MQSPSSGEAPSTGWSRWPTSQPGDINPWLFHAQRFSYVRAHISAFAAGSVALLAINLLVRSPGIWADAWITAWGLVVIIHLVIASMATLAIQLMAEDDVRPASEVSWQPMAPESTWTPPQEPNAAEPEPQVDAWQMPADEETEESGDTERVSWQAASDAAWLNRPPAGDDETDDNEKDEPAQRTPDKPA